MRRSPRARAEDLDAAARAMPYVTVDHGRTGNAIYQVGGKSFVFFRTPRPYAVDPETGERYDDVIVLWVPSPEEKAALLQDRDLPFFTTSHFHGHPSVLLRAGRVGELSREQLVELVQDAWLSRASPTRQRAWLAAHAMSAQ